jgi:uncharacterized protein YkwD
MKVQSFLRATTALTFAFLASCASPEGMRVSVSAGPPANSAEGKLLAEVNAYRSREGHRPLVRNPYLERMARQHSEFMRQNRGRFSLHGKNVSHIGFEGRAFLAKRVYNIGTLGENVASAKSVSMPQLVQLWANSKGHDDNLKASWTETGIGVVEDEDGMIFATQLFGTRSTSRMAFSDRLHAH